MKNINLTTIKAIILMFSMFFANIAICGLFGEKSTKLKNILKKDEGIVLVQFVNNSRVQSGLSNWDEVILEEVNTKKTYKLIPIHNNGFLGTIIFAGALKEGKYRLTDIEETSEYANAGVYSKHNSIPLTSNLGVFSVKKHSITDLGSVILYPMYIEMKNGDIEMRIISINTNEKNHLVNILKELKTNIYNLVSMNPVFGWDEDITDKNKPLLQKVLFSGVPFKYMRDERTNTLIIFRKLGGITFIEDGKDSIEVHTGYYSNFSSYLKVENGHLLAGENGLILFSTSLDGNWEKIETLGVFHNIVDLYYQENTLIGISTNNADPCPKNITCIGTNKLNINLEDKSYSLISRKEKDYNYQDAMDNYYLVPNEKFVFGQKLEYKLKNNILISHKSSALASFPDDKHKISFDNGQSWKKIKTHINKEYFINGYNTDRPLYVNNNKMVYVVASPPYKRPNRAKYIKKKDREKIKKSIKLFLYKMPIDDIDTKNKKYIVSKIDPLCSRLIPDISSDDVLYFSCINGNLIKTTDDGKSWQTTYEK